MDTIKILNHRELGHATSWRSELYKNHTILVIPKLLLEHEPTMDLAEGGMSIPVFFAGAAVHVGDQNLGRMYAIAGTLSLFKTGEPAMIDVIALLPQGTPLPGLSEVIRRGTLLLR